MILQVMDEVRSRLVFKPKILDMAKVLVLVFIGVGLMIFFFNTTKVPHKHRRYNFCRAGIQN